MRALETRADIRRPESCCRTRRACWPAPARRSTCSTSSSSGSTRRSTWPRRATSCWSRGQPCIAIVGDLNAEAHRPHQPRPRGAAAGDTIAPLSSQPPRFVPRGNAAEPASLHVAPLPRKACAIGSSRDHVYSAPAQQAISSAFNLGRRWPSKDCAYAASSAMTIADGLELAVLDDPGPLTGDELHSNSALSAGRSFPRFPPADHFEQEVDPRLRPPRPRCLLCFGMSQRVEAARFVANIPGPLRHHAQSHLPSGRHAARRSCSVQSAAANFAPCMSVAPPAAGRPATHETGVK